MQGLWQQVCGGYAQLWIHHTGHHPRKDPPPCQVWWKVSNSFVLRPPCIWFWVVLFMASTCKALPHCTAPHRTTQTIHCTVNSHAKLPIFHAYYALIGLWRVNDLLSRRLEKLKTLYLYSVPEFSPCRSCTVLCFLMPGLPCCAMELMLHVQPEALSVLMLKLIFFDRGISI